MTKPTPKYRGGRKPIDPDLQKIRITLFFDRYELMELLHSGVLPARSRDILTRELEKAEGKQG